MLSKLSFRNARRQASDYLIYFITIIMAAALIHAFNGLVFSEEIRNLSSMLSNLPLVIGLSSVAVICIIGWLVQYTTGFMLMRRSRELGTYILIGLEHRQVARLFFVENLAVGGLALAVGILLGNLLFQALRAITLTLFHVPYTFNFAFSFKAVILTMFYFLLIYLFALFHGRRRIRKMKIYDLIHLDQKNEKEVIKKGSSRQKIFILSVVCGIIGVVLMLLFNLLCGILGACFIILFLFGFFLSFSSGVPAYFEKHVHQKYRGQTLLVFRTLSAKLATMGVVMATISILFTATLISEGTGLLFDSVFQIRAEQTTCFDLFVSTNEQKETHLDDYKTYIDANIPIKDQWQYSIYQGEDLQVTNYIEANAEYWRNFDCDVMMKASDYTALRAMLGYSEVAMESGKYYIHCMPYLEDLMQNYKEPLTMKGETLEIGGTFAENFTQSLWSGNGRGFILIVPDDIVASASIEVRMIAAMTTEPVSMDDYAALSKIRDEKEGYDTLYSMAAVNDEYASMYAVLVFPLFYLAVILTMVSATILTIQQLSEADRYRRQFGLLHKLGMDRREMTLALRRQFAIYYTMPVVPPILISIPFMIGMGNAFDAGELTSIGQILIIVGMTLGLFFLIYFIYVIVAYTSLKRNVLPT